MTNLLAGATMTVHFQSDDVPPYQKPAIKYKRFGIRCRLRKADYYRWYETEHARDMAFIDLKRHANTRFKARGIVIPREKVER